MVETGSEGRGMNSAEIVNQWRTEIDAILASDLEEPNIVAATESYKRRADRAYKFIERNGYRIVAMLLALHLETTENAPCRTFTDKN